MACDKCVPVMRDSLAIGDDIECRCDYCGERFIIGKPKKCLNCDYYWADMTDDGQRYACHNEDICNVATTAD